MTQPQVDHTARQAHLQDLISGLGDFPSPEALNAPARAACFIGFHIAAALYSIAAGLDVVEGRLDEISCMNNALDSIDETLTKWERA